MWLLLWNANAPECSNVGEHVYQQAREYADKAKCQTGSGRPMVTVTVFFQYHNSEWSLRDQPETFGSRPDPLSENPRFPKTANYSRSVERYFQ